MNSWAFSVSGGWLLAGLVGAGVAVWLSVAHLRRRGGGPRHAGLELLRLSVILLLSFTLLRPEWIRHSERTAKPEVVVLADASGSMATRDVILTNGASARAAWVDAARSNALWQTLNATARVHFETFGAAPSPSTNVAAAVAIVGTDLHAALEQTLQRHRDLKAVLLLSDGDWNLGKSPLGAAARYRELEIPIFAVAVGRETALPDLHLERVAVPAYALVGEQISVPIKVRSQLPRPVRTTITLEVNGRDANRKDVVIPVLGQLQDTLLWSPEAVGESVLTVSLPLESDEAITDNNRQELRINVRTETLKVLVVDSLPRWEYRYLRNALARDPGVDMHCLLFHPGMTPGSGARYLASFPGSKEQIAGYDVVFLGDVGLGNNELTEQDAELVRGLVEQQASGLVLLPGPRGRQSSLLSSALKDLFPVILDESRPQGNLLQNESTLVLTAAGKPHWLTRFEAELTQNEELWKSLPGFWWSAGVEKSRPGADVLAVHSALRNASGRMPLLVSRPFGSGKVLFMGSDSAWRWRRGVEDKYHYRFWSQVVRWMAHQRHLSQQEGLRLSFSPETPQAGETVFLQATAVDLGPAEGGAPALRGSVAEPSGRSEVLDFTALEGGWGVFTSGFTPRQGGRHQIKLEVKATGRVAATAIDVTAPVLEKLGQPANAAMLRDLASLTRGAAATIEGFETLVSQIALLPEPKPLEQRFRMWSSPWWGGLILTLLACYWAGRKWAGLI
jgi:hypothetical protein